MRIGEPAELGVPGAHALSPLHGQPAEGRDARAHIWRAFRVVRVGRQEVPWDACSALFVRLVEIIDAHPEAAGVAADLVEGRETAVAVERRVLNALGHDGAGQLLETN